MFEPVFEGYQKNHSVLAAIHKMAGALKIRVNSWPRAWGTPDLQSTNQQGLVNTSRPSFPMILIKTHLELNLVESPMPTWPAVQIALSREEEAGVAEEHNGQCTECTDLEPLREEVDF